MESAASVERLAFLAELPRTHREGDLLFVHGSPRNPVHEYIFPEDIYNHRKLERNFQLMPARCFAGHTHVPGVYLNEMAKEGSEGRYEFVEPGETNYQFVLDHRQALCNVGAVGQPRDGDWRACYVLFDGSAVRFRRVEYDVEATIRKIYAVPELADFLGDRLREGR